MEKTERLHIREAADWLAQRDNILILCHTRPDGDTLGSAFALRAALRRFRKGRTVSVIRAFRTVSLF